MNHSKKEKFSLIKRLKSFIYGFNGIKILIQEEHNSRIHLFFAILVIIAGFYFRITSGEWVAIIFSIGFVISLEIVNSAIEAVCDFISIERHETIKKIKDLSAAAVLVGAISTAMIGIIIFLPKLLKIIK